jgi:transposase
MLKRLGRETLKRLYITERKPLRDIAKMYGCSPTLVRYRCIKYGIKLRPKNQKRTKISAPVLQKLYVEQSKSVKEIAALFDCSADTVRKRCGEYGISLTATKKIEGLTKTVLQKLYVEEDKDIREIAEMLDCSREVVRRRCKQLAIPLRTPGGRRVAIGESTLRRLYVSEGKSLAAIAKILHCAVSTIFKSVNRCGLHR